MFWVGRPTLIALAGESSVAALSGEDATSVTWRPPFLLIFLLPPGADLSEQLFADFAETFFRGIVSRC